MYLLVRGRDAAFCPRPRERERERARNPEVRRSHPPPKSGQHDVRLQGSVACVPRHRWATTIYCATARTQQVPGDEGSTDRHPNASSPPRRSTGNAVPAQRVPSLGVERGMGPALLVDKTAGVAGTFSILASVRQGRDGRGSSSSSTLLKRRRCHDSRVRRTLDRPTGRPAARLACSYVR
jgi:hypothetical protein